MEGVDEEVSNKVDCWVARCVGEWWRRRKVLMFGGTCGVPP